MVACMMKIIKTKRSIFYCLYVLMLSFFSFLQPLEGSSPLSSPDSYPYKYRGEDIWKASDALEYSRAIEAIDSWLEKEGDAKNTAFLQIEKSKLLYANQQHVEALELFLETLENVPRSNLKPSKKEEVFFDSFFSLYEGALSSYEECEKFVEESKKAYENNPTYASLELYVSAGLANCGEFCEFFDAFSHAYQLRSDSFLSWKILGVIHVRLYEASSSEARRALHREKSVYCLKNAFSRKSSDTTLLVKMVFITPKEERLALFNEIIEHIEAIEIPLRRNDCFYLIDQALQVDAIDFAKRCIAKAQSWYPYSRAIHQFVKQIETLSTQNGNTEHRE